MIRCRAFLVLAWSLPLLRSSRKAIIHEAPSKPSSELEEGTRNCLHLRSEEERIQGKGEHQVMIEESGCYFRFNWLPIGAMLSNSKCAITSNTVNTLNAGHSSNTSPVHNFRHRLFCFNFECLLNMQNWSTTRSAGPGDSLSRWCAVQSFQQNFADQIVATSFRQHSAVLIVATSFLQSFAYQTEAMSFLQNFTVTLWHSFPTKFCSSGQQIFPRQIVAAPFQQNYSDLIVATSFWEHFAHQTVATLVSYLVS